MVSEIWSEQIELQIQVLQSCFIKNEELHFEIDPQIVAQGHLLRRRALGYEVDKAIHPAPILLLGFFTQLPDLTVLLSNDFVAAGSPSSEGLGIGGCRTRGCGSWFRLQPVSLLLFNAIAILSDWSIYGSDTIFSSDRQNCCVGTGIY